MAALDPIVEFRNDHRKVRDGLLDIIDALKAKDVVKARKMLSDINTAIKKPSKQPTQRERSWFTSQTVTV
ncbi:MAG: hypothetical protein Q8R48_01165 [Candidatus Omnitrophota bacterium]|nr:hypothetical protein [Candidatus Omnitrophota bacterium]